MARGGRNTHCTSTPQALGRKEAWDKLLHVPEHAMLDTLDAAQIREAVIGFSGNKLRLVPKLWHKTVRFLRADANVITGMSLWFQPIISHTSYERS
jgi:hypothetical protein